jgi:hypothetical protein
MKRSDIHVPEVKEMYDKTLLGGGPIPAYGFGGRGFAHAIVTEGGRTLRVSGFPAISMQGVVGKNDIGVQTTQALEICARRWRPPARPGTTSCT